MVEIEGVALTVPCENPERQDAIERELEFVLGHPRSGLSPQSRSLLSYLAVGAPGKDPNQSSIAAEVLGRETGFHPDTDPLVRVAMSRLRKSLTAFYDRFGSHRLVRLVIPKGEYRVRAVPNEPALIDSGVSGSGQPTIAWTVTTETTPAARELGHRIDRLVAASIVAAPLVHDGALRVDRIRASSLDAALNEAHRDGATCLARIHVGRPGEPLQLRLHCPRNARPPEVHDLGRHDAPIDIESLVVRIVVGLTDPLLSALPERLSRAHPNSRLALAMTFFRFMASQNRDLLPTCLDALEGAAGSRLASPLIDVLRVDAIRTNYAFATDRVPELSHKLIEDAGQAFEKDPYQPYAALTHAYAAVAVGVQTPDDVLRSVSDADGWHGSLKEDRMLCLTLAALQRGVAPGFAACKPGTFIGDAAHILLAIRQEDVQSAAERAFSMRKNENFWTRVFQCSVAADLGRHQQARKFYAQLKSEEPDVEDYAGRAIISMIPGRDLQSRLISNLARMS